jgi:SAM-dependent methyltransferase
MSDDPTSIHEFDLELICEYFANLHRQGPGSPAVTKTALGFVDALGPDSKIADLGCGTGGQTMELAGLTPGRITGVDLFPRLIDIFNANSRKLGLQDRVKGIVGSMDRLEFADEELDLIWAEGSIYNIGFERGLKEWRRFLKPGGFIAVSEACWFTAERPAEIEAFWDSEYPGIDTIPRKLEQLQNAGYVPVASFALPVDCWTDHFYAPQVSAQEKFLEAHAGNRAAGAFIENQRHEERLYHKYKDYYGYAFFVGKKI